MMKSTIISGGASGIGLAMVKKIAEEDEHFVFMVDNSQKHLDKAMEENKNDNIIPINADIRSENILNSTLNLHIDKLKNLSNIISNAGIHRFHFESDGSTWNEVIETNLTGGYNFVMQLLPYLKKSPSKNRNILFISSAAASRAVPDALPYAVSKAGIECLMKNMAAMLSSKEILVNCIAPGWVETKMTDQVVQKVAGLKKLPESKILEYFENQSLLKKSASPEEIANLAQYLLSEKQISMTGQVLHIDNGLVV